MALFNYSELCYAYPPRLACFACPREREDGDRERTVREKTRHNRKIWSARRTKYHGPHKEAEKSPVDEIIISSV